MKRRVVINERKRENQDVVSGRSKKKEKIR